MHLYKAQEGGFLMQEERKGGRKERGEGMAEGAGNG